MKFFECEQERTFTFLKREKALFIKDNKLSTRPEEEIGGIFISQCGNIYSYGTTRIKKIDNNFLK